MKKPTFEEVRLVHSRLSAVSFKPRETVDLSVLDGSSGSESIQDIIGFHESTSADIMIMKEKTSNISDPELPFCSASKRLFAACVSGDTNSVATLISEISSARDKDKNKDDNLCDANSANISGENILDTVLQEQWDLAEILNMPNSFQSLATCLHIASESGAGL